MTGKIINEYGTIYISEKVITEIASEATMKSYGVVGLAYKNLSDGLLILLNRENMTKGVKVSVKNNEIVLDLTLVLEYGVSLAVVCQNIIDNVKFNVEKTTGLTVNSVNILVQDMRIND